MDTSSTDHGRIYKSARDDGGPRNFDLWDSLESDTESLVQEKVYQRDLQKRILNDGGDIGSSYNDRPHNIGRAEHENDRSPQPDISESRGDQKPTFLRQTPSPDEYDDLRYDPDWRKKLPGSQFLQKNFNSKDPEYFMRHARYKSPTQRHEFAVIHSPVLSEMNTPHIPPIPLQSSNSINPQGDQNTVHSVPQSLPASSKSTPRLNLDEIMKVKQGIQPSDEENQSIVQNSERLNALAMQRRPSQKSRPDRPKEDIIERNKATLGMNFHKQGSYLKAYKQRGENPDHANQSLQSVEDTASSNSTESPDNAPNLEMMWIQKTQKLKTHNQSKHLAKARLQHHRAKSSGPTIQPVKKHHLQTLSEKQTYSPPDSSIVSHCSHSSSPTINLNINFNTSAKVAEPYFISEPWKQLYTLVLPSLPQSGIKNDEYNSRFKWPSNALRPPLPPAPSVEHEIKEVNNKNSNGINPTRPPPFQESITSNDPQLMGFYEEGKKNFAHALQTYGGAYPVLPPIDRSNSSKLCGGKPEEATNTIHKNISEGYLAQFEKQKAKSTYKAYTLKDYKSLNLEMKLGGLGHSNNVAKDVTEKIRQQKLYSNVIREQNKKISRIPSVPTWNAVGSNNKNSIPRNKALEYAKTIAKPKAPQQPKKVSINKTEQKRLFEHSAYLQLGVDLTQLSTLEMLKQRHEQEKQAVARFSNIHGNSSTSQFSSH
ncbi:hypothetical protein C0J50_8122 [Silurus asotus]|uniref:Jhy protein homolog n=1 Tax=Silurus asotus TaxID=30991 RepID=A0AAD5B5T4_SILAS|nr:hypothetical protein C0J50_8122 [Silurus asotus]